MFLDEPGDISEPLREARDITVEDRELRHEHDEAQVERALEELLRRLQRGRKVDRRAIEGVIARGKQPLGGRDEIHELRIAFEIEIRPAWVVLGDERKRSRRRLRRRSDARFGQTLERG